MIKKFFVVLELGKLEYHLQVLESTRFEYLFLKKKKKKKNLHSTRVYQTQVLCNFFFKKVLELGILEYCVNGT